MNQSPVHFPLPVETQAAWTKQLEKVKPSTDFLVNDCSSLDNDYLFIYLFGITLMLLRNLICNELSTYNVVLHFTQLLCSNKALTNVSKASDDGKNKKSNNISNLWATFQDIP